MKCWEETKQRKCTFGIICIITFWVDSCFEARYLTLRSVLFVSTLSGNFQLWQLRQLFKFCHVHAVIFSSNHLISIFFCSAEWIFLHGLLLQTLESSWLLDISQRILGHYASYCWSSDLRFLRLVQLSPLVPVFSFSWC